MPSSFKMRKPYEIPSSLDSCHENKTDSRSDSKAAILRATLLDNYGQQQLSSSAISMNASLIKGPKEPPKEFNSPPSLPL
jgi:hypothetical protein